MLLTIISPPSNMISDFTCFFVHIAKGHETPPDYSDPVFPKIPPEFHNDNQKQSPKEGPRKGCNKRVRNEQMGSAFTQCLFCEIMCSQTKVLCRILSQLM